MIACHVPGQTKLEAWGRLHQLRAATAALPHCSRAGTCIACRMLLPKALPEVCKFLCHCLLSGTAQQASPTHDSPTKTSAVHAEKPSPCKYQNNPAKPK